MISVARTMHAGSNMNVLAQGLCWIARDRAAANRSVGFIACDDPAAAGGQEMPDGLTDREIEMVSAVAALLEEIRRPVKDRLALGAGTCLHVTAVGVAWEYEGAGIAARLLQTALREAKARGFLHAFAECTSPASRKCHEKAGFKSLHGISGNTFLVDGGYPFKGCHLDIHLMWKRLGEEKTP